MELHQQVVGAGASVDTQFAELGSGVALHRGDNVVDLKRYPLEGGAGDVDFFADLWRMELTTPPGTLPAWKRVGGGSAPDPSGGAADPRGGIIIIIISITITITI